MPVVIAYAFVVLIWSTTPLAIQWSNSSVPFIASVTIRMVLALIVCSLLLVILRKPLVTDRRDWLAFVAGAVGLYPNMLIVYWSSQFISSGLMAVILGVYPFVVGLFSLLFLRENIFSPIRFLALAIAISGLAVIHIEQLNLGGDAIYGVFGMLASAFLFGFSSVWLKISGAHIDPLRQSTGALVFAVPAFVATWWLLGGEFTAVVDIKSMVGLGYLAIAGSVIGHTLFFYVLRYCSMMSVSLITLITPVMALSLGVVVAKELVTVATVVGSLMVVLSLAVYQGVFTYLWRYFEKQYLQVWCIRGKQVPSLLQSNMSCLDKSVLIVS